MKKSLLIIVAAFFIGRTSAQTNVYHEFPDSNAVWNITSQGCCWAGCPGPPSPNPLIGDYNFSQYIAGDTTINSVVYHKLYKSGNAHEYCSSGNFVNNWTYYNDYVAAFREDTAMRRVFVLLPAAASECVLYDFTAAVGDTVDFCDGEAIVSSIDSILIGNTYRKRFNIVGSPYSIIEGIGSTSGLLENLYPFEYSGNLICFIQEGQTTYPDTLTSCNLITSIYEGQRFNQELSIGPNPFSSTTIIRAQFHMQNASLKVLNCVGETVAEVNSINGLTFSFDRGNLCAGLYFFQLSQNGVVLGTGRGIIAD
jgi:hypothetical protein